MKFRITKERIAAVVTTVALATAGGIALANAAETSVAGADPALPDPFKTSIPLKLYNASGAEVTTGSTTQPIAAFAAADSAPRAGDEYASLFVHLPQSTVPQGAWSGVQASGTDKFAGAGAVAAPGPLAGKAYVRLGSGGYTLADVVAALPQTDLGASYVGVYELRLRSSSSVSGVADQYAAAYVKVTGTTWTVTTAPVLGGGTATPTTPPAGVVATSVAPTWPATLTYGTAATVAVSVNPASGSAKPTGSVRLVSGATTLATATLSGGTANLALSATALSPGTTSLKVVYAGVANTWGASESGSRSFTVAKALPGRPTYKTTKAPTPTKKGTATVTVPTPSGLAAAGGTASVVIKKGKTTKTLKVTVVNGKATVKLPKLAPGKWTVTVSYAGDAKYLAATSKTFKLKVKAAKKT